MFDNRRRLDEVCAAIVDCSHSTPVWQDAGHLVLRSHNVRGGRLNLSERSYTDEPTFLERTRRALPGHGDLVITREAPMGEVCMIPEGLECCLGQRLVLLRPKPDVDAKYLLYAMQSPAVQTQIRWNEGTGSTVSNLRIPVLSALMIPLPDRSLQSAISSILGALDDKMELNRMLSETLEAMARALFKSWFVDFDPVHAKAAGRAPRCVDAALAMTFPREFSASTLGDVPQGWSTAPLDTVASFRNGLALQRFPPGDGEPRLPVVKIAQLRTGTADSGEWATAAIDPACIIDDGDVVFSWSGSLMVAVWRGGRAALNQHLFRVTSSLPKWFYLGWLLEHLPSFQRIAADKATTMGHIQRHHLSEALCIVPDAAVITAASRTLGPLVELQQQLHMGSRTLAELRDALLPRLLSGELTVKAAERVVGASV